MTKDERIALVNADLAAGRITVRLKPDGPAVTMRQVGGGHGYLPMMVVDTMQPLTSFRIENGGRVTLCMMDGSGWARVDGGDPGDEDRS